MMNPCYGCPKYREYGEYLDDVLISKTPVSEPVQPVKPDLDNSHNKKKPKVERAVPKMKPEPQSGPCQMLGCKRQAEIKGFCNSCLAVRKYHEAKGNEPPDSLTPAQIKRRDRKGI